MKRNKENEEEKISIQTKIQKVKTRIYNSSLLYNSTV